METMSCETYNVYCLVLYRETKQNWKTLVQGLGQLERGSWMGQGGSRAVPAPLGGSGGEGRGGSGDRAGGRGLLEASQSTALGAPG